MKYTIGCLMGCVGLLVACSPQPLPAPAPSAPAASPSTGRSPDAAVKPPVPLPSPSALPSGSPKVDFQPVDEAPPVDAQRPDRASPAPADPAPTSGTVNPEAPRSAGDPGDARTPAQRMQPLVPPKAPVVPTKRGKPIGPATDCDNDGKADDSLVDYNDDGVPDECLRGDG